MITNIPIVVNETTFAEKEGYQYSVQEGSITHYFKTKAEADKKARKCNSIVEDIDE